MGSQGKAVANIYIKCKGFLTPRWPGLSSILEINTSNYEWFRVEEQEKEQENEQEEEQEEEQK